MAAITCPKCGEDQPEAPACRRCGLAAVRFDSFAAETDAELPPELEQSWERCLGAWDDAAGHDALADTAARSGAFAQAARLYRGYLRGHPGDERASAQLQRIGRMAEAAALIAPPGAHRAEREHPPYRGAVWLLICFGLLAAAGASYAYLTREAGDRRPPDLDPPIEWQSQPPAGRPR